MGTHLQHPIPYVVYCDFESLLKPMDTVYPGPQISISKKISKQTKHIACSFAFFIIGLHGKPFKNKLTPYSGENAAEEFLNYYYKKLRKIQKS